MQKLDVKAFGLAGGILWAAAVVLMSISAAVWNWGTIWVILLSSFYIGYRPTVLGTAIGAVWAFFDAFVGCFLFAWLYNKFSK